MRICELSRVFKPQHNGGMAVAVTESCRALSEHHDVHLICAELPENYEHEQPFSISTLPVGIKETSKFCKLAREEFDRLHKEEPFDAVISHSSSARDFLMHDRVNVPVIQVDHGNSLGSLKDNMNILQTCDNKEDAFKKAVECLSRSIYTNDPIWGIPECKMMQMHDANIALTLQAWDDYIMGYQCKKDNVHVLVNPCTEGHGGNKNGPVIVCAANSLPIKGMKWLSEIETDRGILVIGPINEVKGKSKITYTGQIPAKDVQRYMAKGSVFANISIQNRGHLTTLGQATACNLPVVGWNTPDVCMVGHPVPIGRMDLFNAKIKEVLDDWRNNSYFAKKKWDCYYNPKRYAMKMTEIIEGLLK